MTRGIGIRPCEDADDAALWRMLEPVFRAGDSYAIDRDISRQAALRYWRGGGRRVFVATLGGAVVASYYLVRNQAGGGAHVCNCGFVTDPAARGQGLARRMLDDALRVAAESGFRAMQFNFVLASNTRAVDIWQRAGFDIVGRLPEAFLHPQLGYVDALVMYRRLAQPAG